MFNAVRLIFLVAALGCVLAALWLLRRPSGPRDADGVASPTVLRIPPEYGGAADPLLAYIGLSKAWGSQVLARPLDADGHPVETIPLAGSRQVVSAQFVAPDRLYYVELGESRRGRVRLARWIEGSWRDDAAPIDLGNDAARLAGDGVRWTAVTGPGEAGSQWRMWYVARGGNIGRVAYATSNDGVRWTARPEPVWELPAGESIESISVLPYAGTLRAWAVIRTKERPFGELVGFNVGADGTPSGDPETVAWQAPELRFGSLPKNAMPIVDARAESGEDGTRQVRLYITYRNEKGTTAITVAEDFAVAGERSPTVFARRVKPLVETGSDRSGPGRSYGGIAALGVAAAGLLGLWVRTGTARLDDPGPAEPLDPADSEAE